MSQYAKYARNRRKLLTTTTTPDTDDDEYPLTAAIYARVSTKDQNAENQLRRLRKVARKAGWYVIADFVDEGISGAKGRDQRPAFDALCSAATAREVDIIMVWSVDRLGRSLQHLVSFMEEMKQLGVGLYLHKEKIDTTTPSGAAMFGMVGVFAQFEREMISARVKAGVARARKEGKRLGRPKVTNHRLRDEIIEMRAAGETLRSIHEAVGVSLGTVQNVLRAAA